LTRVDPNQALGSRHVKQFRSPAEFAPHAAWLLTDPSLDPSNCECKYCSKDTGHPSKSRSRCDRSDTPATVTSISSRRTCRSTPPTLLRQLTRSASSSAPERSRARIRRQPSLRKIPPQEEDGGAEALPSQLSDLTALSLGRFYRNQELVWLILDKPLSIHTDSHSGKDYTIHFWPGVIKNAISYTSDQQTDSPETRYLVTIISVERTYSVPQKSIIPFRAYSFDENTLTDLRPLSTGAPPDGLSHGFDPLPQYATPETPSPGSVLKRSPLELLIADITAARRIATTWTATGGYHLRSRQSDEPAGTIDSSCADAPHVGSPPLRRSLEGQDRRRYRGLWWGVERVWVGDLLVLSFPENSIKYSNEDSSCFAHSARDEAFPHEGRKPEEKCVFLKLRALEPVRTDQGFTALEAIGSMYKLTPSLDSVQTGPGDLDLPRPPDGFAFRAVFSAGIETRLPLRLIRGRYYPRLYSSMDKELVPAERGLKAMEGLGPPGSGAWRPSKHIIESRHGMLNIAQDRNC